MRRILLIISLVSAIFIDANAQTGNVRLGLKLGPAVDWASSGSTAVTNDGIRLGGNAGLVCDYFFADNIAVSSGVNFNFLRLKYSFIDYRRVEDFLEETNISVSRRLKASNIEIPLKVKIRYEVFDSFLIYAEAGAGLSLNFKDYAKDSYSYYWVSSEGQSFVDCTNQYRPLQLSMVFGLGTEYEINRNLSFFAQLTFDHAFSNAFVNSLEKQTGSILRNNYVGIEVGIMH
jgi:hypothetical protein